MYSSNHRTYGELIKAELIELFENTLKRFSVVNTPRYIVNTFSQFINELDPTLFESLTQLGVLLDFKLDNTQDTLDSLNLLIETEDFKNLLNEHLLKSIPFENYVLDKTNGNIFPTTYGEHFKAVILALLKHPELKTLEQKDEFVMNNLVLGGSYGDNSYYTDRDWLMGEWSSAIHKAEPYNAVEEVKHYIKLNIEVVQNYYKGTKRM